VEMMVKVEDDGKGEEEGYGWLRRLLEAAEVSDLFDKAAAWAEDAGCVESDLQDEEVLHDLLYHLELKRLQQKRLRKAVAGSISPCSPTSTPCSPPTSPTSAGMAKLALIAPELIGEADEIAISGREGNKLFKMMYYVANGSSLDDSMLGTVQDKLDKPPKAQAGLAAEEDGDFFFDPEPRQQVTSPEPDPVPAPPPNSEGRKVAKLMLGKLERATVIIRPSSPPKSARSVASRPPSPAKEKVHEILDQLLLSREEIERRDEKLRTLKAGESDEALNAEPLPLEESSAPSDEHLSAAPTKQACSDKEEDPFTPESRGQRQGFGRQVSDFQPAHSAFDRQISAPAGLNLEGTQSKFTKASADQAMKDAAQLKTEARREAQAIHTNRTRKRRHVVLSAKFQEPFFYFSVLLKVILQMLGCTVYNPNTDNEETYKEEANGRWLRTFNENLELVKKTEGFVLQLQGNKWAEKSHMQWAEEKQSGWLDVPRIGIWLSWSSNYMGYTYLLKRLVNAIQKADGQWATDRAEGVVMCNEVYEGQRNADGKPHGYGKVTFPTGDVYQGNWENGWRSGHGRSTFASGDIYEGNWENSKFSGHGKFAYASGAIYEGNWENGKRNGQGKHTSASGVVQDGEWKDGNFKG